MASNTDGASRAVSVRALQAMPEELTPIKHGFLWKRSKLFKVWLSRWYQLNASGLKYAISPKTIAEEGRLALAPPIIKALPLPSARYRNGADMFGVRLVNAAGRRRDLYCDDQALLDSWAKAILRASCAYGSGAAAPGSGAGAGAASRASSGLPAHLAPHSRTASHSGGLKLSDVVSIDWQGGILGTGLFSCVLAGCEVGGSCSPVAVKIIKAEAYEQYRDIVQREAMVWSAVGYHPHVCQLREVLESPCRMYFVSELCEGGSLLGRLAESATYCERDVARIARQLLLAVRHLHRHAIVHMDLKPDNIVYSNRREDSPIKLIDFSLASFFSMPTDPGGTPDYVAPELLNNPEHFAKVGCGPEVDMWAVGIIIFFLLCGETPFQSANLEQVLERVKGAQWAFHGRRWALVSEGARDLVASLLRPDPLARLSADEALRHPWLARPVEALSQAVLLDAVHAFRAAVAEHNHAQRQSWLKQVKAGSEQLLAASGANSMSHLAGLQGVTPVELAHLALPGGPSSSGGLLGGLLGQRPSINSSRFSTRASDSAGAGGGRGSGASNGRASPTSKSAHGSQASQPVSGLLGMAVNSGSYTSQLRPGGLLSGGAAGGTPAAGAGAGGSFSHGPSRHATAAAAAAAAGHASPGHSPLGATSPRSPLGMQVARSRRASEAAAYAVALMERQESITQMAAQGIAPSGNMALVAAAAAVKARRASDMSTYALLQQQLMEGGGAGGGGGTPHGPGSAPASSVGCSSRGAGSGRAAAAAAAIAAAAAAAAHAAGQPAYNTAVSQPNLGLSHLANVSGRSSASEPAARGGASPVRSVTRQSQPHLPRGGGGGGEAPALAPAAASSSTASAPASAPGAMARPRSHEPHNAVARTLAAQPAGGFAAAAGGATDAQQQPLPRKFASYPAMPTAWMSGQSSREVGATAGSGGRSNSPPAASAGPGAPGTPAPSSGAGAAGPGSGGLGGSFGSGAQRRASQSFTHGMPVTLPSTVFMHGPSPLSVASHRSQGRRSAGKAFAAALQDALQGGSPTGTSAKKLQPGAVDAVARVSPTAVSTHGASAPLGGGSGLGPAAGPAQQEGGSGTMARSATRMYQAVLRANLSGGPAAAQAPEPAPQAPAAADAAGEAAALTQRRRQALAAASSSSGSSVGSQASGRAPTNLFVQVPPAPLGNVPIALVQQQQQQPSGGAGASAGFGLPPKSTSGGQPYIHTQRASTSSDLPQAIGATAGSSTRSSSGNHVQATLLGMVEAMGANGGRSSSATGDGARPFSSGTHHRTAASSSASGMGSAAAAAAPPPAGASTAAAPAGAPSISQLLCLQPDVLAASRHGSFMSSKPSLETIPSMDPESMSGLLRPIRDPAAAAALLAQGTDEGEQDEEGRAAAPPAGPGLRPGRSIGAAGGGEWSPGNQGLQHFLSPSTSVPAPQPPRSPLASGSGAHMAASASGGLEGGSAGGMLPASALTSHSQGGGQAASGSSMSGRQRGVRRSTTASNLLVQVLASTSQAGRPVSGGSNAFAATAGAHTAAAAAVDAQTADCSRSSSGNGDGDGVISRSGSHGSYGHNSAGSRVMSLTRQAMADADGSQEHLAVEASAGSSRHVSGSNASSASGLAAARLQRTNSQADSQFKLVMQQLAVGSPSGAPVVRMSSQRSLQQMLQASMQGESHLQQQQQQQHEPQGQGQALQPAMASERPTSRSGCSRKSLLGLVNMVNVNTATATNSGGRTTSDNARAGGGSPTAAALASQGGGSANDGGSEHASPRAAASAAASTGSFSRRSLLHPGPGAAGSGAAPPLSAGPLSDGTPPSATALADWLSPRVAAAGGGGSRRSLLSAAQAGALAGPGLGEFSLGVGRGQQLQLQLQPMSRGGSFTAGQRGLLASPGSQGPASPMAMAGGPPVSNSSQGAGPSLSYLLSQAGGLAQQAQASAAQQLLLRQQQPHAGAGPSTQQQHVAQSRPDSSSSNPLAALHASSMAALAGLGAGGGGGGGGSGGGSGQGTPRGGFLARAGAQALQEHEELLQQQQRHHQQNHYQQQDSPQAGPSSRGGSGMHRQAGAGQAPTSTGGGLSALLAQAGPLAQRAQAAAAQQLQQHAQPANSASAAQQGPPSQGHTASGPQQRPPSGQAGASPFAAAAANSASATPPASAGSLQALLAQAGPLALRAQVSAAQQLHAASSVSQLSAQPSPRVTGQLPAAGLMHLGPASDNSRPNSAAPGALSSANSLNALLMQAGPLAQQAQASAAQQLHAAASGGSQQLGSRQGSGCSAAAAGAAAGGLQHTGSRADFHTRLQDGLRQANLPRGMGNGGASGSGPVSEGSPRPLPGSAVGSTLAALLSQAGPLAQQAQASAAMQQQLLMQRAGSGQRTQGGGGPNSGGMGTGGPSSGGAAAAPR